jgi:hypothetical protein
LTEVTYQNLGDKLVEAVPELRTRYEQELQWWGEEEPGAHNIYGDVLDPFLISLLKSESKSLAEEETLKRVFDFLEELANNDDSRVQDVAGATVLERLHGAGELQRARSYMGPRTLQMSREIEEWQPGKKSSVPL